MHWLRKAGYEHYEVSNFAKPGFRSRHNSSYWKGIPYLGLGPSAHSFNGKERRWNISNNHVYNKTMHDEKPERETEVLTSLQQLNETIMISLRTKEGLNLKRIEAAWGEKEKYRIVTALGRYKKSGLIHMTDHFAQLTDEGMLRADGIAADLFL
jgi:oxygen-independent coproporphyrinogen-3 oxidase